MGRRFQSGHVITFPVPTILNATDGGPRTVLVVAKANTTAYQPVLYTRSSGAHGWWFEIDSTGGLHANYGTGTTARNTGTVTVSTASLLTASKDNGGSVHPFGRNFTGASFATDSGDIDSGFTLVDGTAIDTSYGIQIGRWGNTGTDYAADLEIYFIAVWNSILTGAAIAALTKTAAALKAAADYWISFEGTTATDSAGGSPTITGTTTVSDPTGFFASGLVQALPVASESSTAQAIVGSKRAALPVASEASTAQALAGKKSGALPVAGETSEALTFGTPEGGLVQALPVATEINEARTIVGSKRQELPPAYEYSSAMTLGGGAPQGSGVMILGDIMDEMAARLRLAPSLAGRTFAYPPSAIKAPAAIVTYPDNYTYDRTYGRGMDQMTGEVVVAVGRPTERQSRDRLTKYVDGAGPESVKALLDGTDYASCDTVRVSSATFDVVVIGGVDYLAAIFSIDIAGRGAQL